MNVLMRFSYQLVTLMWLVVITTPVLAITVSPSPSYTGSYTVSWGSPEGCIYDEEDNTYDCNRLWEKVGSGSWANVSVTTGATSKAYSGQANNTYEYQLCWSDVSPGYSTSNCGEPLGVGSVTVTVMDLPPAVPNVPTVPANDTDGTYTISWNSVTGATSYDLQEVENGSSTWVTVNTSPITSASYNRTKGDGVWHYRVRACNPACSAYSSSSAAIFVAITPGPPTQAPTISPSPSTNGNHTVNWTKPSGTVNKYKVYRSTDLLDGNGYSSWTEEYNGASTSQPYNNLLSGNHIYYYVACNVVSGFESCSANSSNSSIGIVNLPPIAVADSTSTLEDNLKVVNVVGNDTGPEAGDTLSITAVTQPANGTVTNNTSTITYTPAANFNGNDSVTYTVSDGTSTANAVLSITVTSDNDDPVAVDDSDITIEDVPITVSVLLNDSDVDPADTLSISTVTTPSNGTTTNTSTTITYTPNLDYSGSDSFTYTLSDGNGGTDTATVTLQIDSNTINDDDGTYRVEWAAAAGQVDTYKLWERVGATGTFTEIMDANALSWDIFDKADGTYAYKVEACNTSGCSQYTDIINAFVNYPAPGTITGLIGPVGSFDGDAALSWTALPPSNIVVHHEVFETFSGSSLSYDTASTVANYTVSTGFSADINGIHTFKVRACNENGCGGYSDPIDVVFSEAGTVSSVPSLTSETAETLESALWPIFNGTVPGNHDVTGAGAARYTIPIAVPPGTNGMQPSLALTYSSQNLNNGLMGYGWTLSGAGAAINRCGQTLAQNGNLHAVDYTSEDRFCYQGQQLVVKSNSINGYGGNDSEYRTVNDGFNRITSQTTSGNEPDSFKVETKGGLTLHFGDWDDNSGDAFIEAEGKTVAAKWLLKRVEDRNGNYMLYHYEKDTEGGFFNGDYRPWYIEYTLNGAVSPAMSAYAKVEFNYEDRSDIITRYHAGSKVKHAKRLESITAYVDANFDGFNPTETEWVRDYRLNYEEIDSTDFPRLTDVTLYVPDGSGGEEYTLTTEFDWVAELNGYDLPPSTAWTGQTPLTGAFEKWADFDGDGRMDYVTTSGASHYVSLVNSDGDGYDSVSTWTAYAKGDSGFETLADLDGDGNADYFTVDNNGTHYWALSNGTTNYTKSSYTTGHSVVSGDVQKLLDFNGDSLPDYLLASGSTYTVRLNNAGAGYQSSQSWSGGPDLGPPR